MVGDGGGVSIVRSTSVREQLIIDSGFLGGLSTKFTFFLVDGGVSRGCGSSNIQHVGWDEEVQTPTKILPLKDFVTFSLACSIAVTESASMESGASLSFLFFYFCLVYAGWPTY